MRSLTSFFRLPGGERNVVFRTAWRLLALRLRLQQPRLGRNGEGEQSRRRTDSVRAARLAHLVRRTAEVLPFSTTCLDRAFVLTSLLEDELLHSALRIGVRPVTKDRLDAHAWVEHAGNRLFLGEEGAYVSFDAHLTSNWR
jgi:hypothetical protein